MQKKLDFGKIFKEEAEKLVKAREKCKDVHDANIKAAGYEVENAIRRFFKGMLPSRFHVSQGHLIDRNKVISPQIDMIISDNTTIPSLMTTDDETVFIPIESVYAIAEIKSTFYRSGNYINKFSETLKYIREEMTRPLVENTAYEMLTKGKGPKADTLLRDMILGKPNKYLNPLYSFMLFVNSGDVKTEDIERIFTETDYENLPSITVMLNDAVIAYGKLDEDVKGFGFSKYPWLNQSQDFRWYIIHPKIESDSWSIEGNNLGLTYFALLNHLNESFLEPPELRQYLGDMLMIRRSKMIEIRKTLENATKEKVESKGQI